MALYYPPEWGKRGSNPSDWPERRLPESMGDAVAQAKTAGESLISSDSGIPIITATGEGATLPTTEPITIDVTGGRELSLFRNPWVVVGGTVAILGILSLFLRKD